MPTQAPRRKPSLRMQFALSLLVAAVAITALIVFVEANNHTASQPIVSANAVSEENREATIVVGQDQRPHRVRLKAGQSGKAGLIGAIARYMNHQLSLGVLTGSLQSTRCSVAAGSRAGRTVYHCSAIVANVSYPIDGVVNTTARQVIFCKHDLPPVPSMTIPVSPRCT